MRSRMMTALATATLAAALAGCTSGNGEDPGDGDGGGGGGADVGTSLSTTETDLGTIVVDADGMVVYQFDSDTQGGDASTCTGECAANWPAVPGSADAAALDGAYGGGASDIEGVVGSITGIDGEPHLTLNGWPLYYFAGDSAAGDTNGQGVNDVWWVLTPAGEPIRE